MIKVTDIKAQIKRPDRYSVFLDGSYAFSMTQDELVDNEVKVGKSLSQMEVKALVQKSEEGKVYNLLVKKAATRPHSEYELNQYLYKKKLPKEASALFIEKLKKASLVDDANYARAVIESKQKSKSSRYIRGYLKSKGVASEVINDQLDNSDFFALRIQIKKMSKKSIFKDQRKMIESLMRKGFKYSEIKTELEKKEDSLS